MRTTRLLFLGIALLIWAGTGRSQQPAKAVDTKELDQGINNALREVINNGAKLYNRPINDYAGCYRLFEGSLTTLKPLLGHRPGLQKVIDDAFAAAAREQSIPERAFILRGALDRVREETGTLWQRLGGEKNVRKIVDDFMALEHTDPKVDFFRGGKVKLTEKQLDELKQKIVELISQVSGGPLKYSGRSMKDAHKGMAITNAQFDALVADLKQAIDKNNVKAADRDAVLAAVEGTRKDTVEDKKDDGKKVDMPAPKREEKPKQKKEEEPTPKKDDGKKPAGAEVSGKITYNGKPVAGGTITFVPVEGKSSKPITADVNEDGSYSVKKPPLGDYIVTIAPPAGKEKAKDAVPAQYRDQKTSSLKVNFKEGRNKHDIELTD
jgi:hemoglobin